MYSQSPAIGDRPTEPPSPAGLRTLWPLQEIPTETCLVLARP